MEKEEQIKIVGLLRIMSEGDSHDWSDWIFNTMISRAAQGKNPLMENLYHSYEMDTKEGLPYWMWDVIENAAKNKNIGILAFLDTYNNKGTEISNYQEFLALIKNTTAYILSHSIWEKIKQRL